MMRSSRREFLAAAAGAVPALCGLKAADRRAASPPRERLGIVVHSYRIRWAADRDSKFRDPLAFLEFCWQRGAGGVQIPLGVRDEKYASRLRKQLEMHGLSLEGSIRLPRDKADVERFATEVQSACQCGAMIVRTVTLAGRRYEAFASADAFRQFAKQARRSLALARPIVERHKVRLAVENHKDWQAGELVDLIKEIGSPFVGVCVDTGNNLALLEKPLETTQALAAHAFTTHLKDMAVAEYADGFLLAEVPLGTGFLDLGQIIATLRRAQPRVPLNLEMITRDPLKIPCLSRKYWATLEKVPGRRLADILALVRAKGGKKSLPSLDGLSREAKIQREEENVRQCLRYARERLLG
jgi:sugar phosphate isomerase/epimerase